MTEFEPKQEIPKVEIYTPASPEELEMLADYLKNNPDTEKEDNLESKNEFHKLVVEFKEKHSLEILSAISELDAENSIIRDSAKEDLRAIQKIKDSLPPSDELKSEYKILSQAVGMVNNGKVVHDR